MRTITTEDLIAGCGDFSLDAGITIQTALEPVAGPGSPVKPAVYAGGNYQLDERWINGEKTLVVSLDNVPSQANRIEAELEKAQPQLGLPMIVLDLSSAGHLPPHLPASISSFKFPHRSADAYLRDCLLGGVPFLKTEIGKKIFSATAERPQALYEWFPQALLFGYWQSHLGTKRSQAKLARSWVSEIIGIDPATTDTRVAGLKGDPINLNVDETIGFSEDDLTDWSAAADAVAQPADKGKGKKGRGKLSGIGHGQVPFGGSGSDPGARSAVSFRGIHQQATVSFASLRRITTGDAKADAAGRALLVAIGLAGHSLAAGRPFSLRSQCDLKPVSSQWRWLGEQDEDIAPLDFTAAASLVSGCSRAAESAGLPVGSKWPGPLTVTPNPALEKAIRSTWPLDD